MERATMVFWAANSVDLDFVVICSSEQGLLNK